MTAGDRIKRSLWLLWIPALVAVDQGAKLAVSRALPVNDPAYLLPNGFFHIHPVYNFKTVETIARRAQETGIGAWFWWTLEILLITAAVIIALLIIRLLYKVLILAFGQGDGRVRRTAGKTVTVLLISVYLCGVIDRLFWEGALDYFCVVFKRSDDAGAVQATHFAFDFKDICLYVMGILMLYLVARAIIDLAAFRIKDEQGYGAFKEKLHAVFKRKKKTKKE